MRQQGKIIKWLDDKGFGFISVEGSDDQIFVHITAFPKGQLPPVIGAEIMYDLVSSHKNGFQAKNVSYLNRQQETKPSLKSKSLTKKKNSYSNTAILVLIFACSLLPFYQFYKKIYGVDSSQYITTEYTNSIEEAKEIQPKAFLTNSESSNSNSMNSNSTNHANGNARFQCSGKTRCTEMSSCDEAKFYLSSCPGSITDGDGDGIPCEDQWCGH